MKNAIILCSGGLDSVTAANYVKKRLNNDNLIILFFDYGQRTLSQERKASKTCASSLKAKFLEIKLPFLNEMSTSLLNKKEKAKKIERKDLKNTAKESEKWYVPFRNTIFLTISMALAESLYIKEKKVYDIFTGFKNEGKESFPDTTQEFVEEMNKLKRISTKVKFKVLAPLIKMDKEDIILLGKKLGIKLEDTFSCYASNSKNHCGSCLSCRLRRAGFYWANIEDPTKYDCK